MAMTDGAAAPHGAGPQKTGAPGAGEAAGAAVMHFPAEAIALLRCPVCGTGFSPAARALRCENGHSYDVARQGYVNFLPGGAHPGTADTAEMVAAREAFLAAGHYGGLREFVCRTALRAVSGGGLDAAAGCLVEVGAGTGYYLAGVLDRFPERTGLALDISKFAARRAARAHERMAAIVCDAWSTLPAADASAALILDIFAPRNPPEFRRVLRPDGALVVVTPSPRHLQELVAGLGLLTVDERKPERLEQSLSGEFELVAQTEYEAPLSLTSAEAAALAAMGPSAHHIKPKESAERLAAFGSKVEVTLSVRASTYRPK